MVAAMRLPSPERLHAPALLVLRAVPAGLMLFGHGLGKLTGFAAKSATFSDPLGIGSLPSLALATFAEFFCSILVLAGVATRLAALPLVATMSVAAFIVHANDPFPKRELPLLYLTIFAVVAMVGPGPWSIDGLRRRR